MSQGLKTTIQVLNARDFVFVEVKVVDRTALLQILDDLNVFSVEHQVRYPEE
jgi:hypothetical protein